MNSNTKLAAIQLELYQLDEISDLKSFSHRVVISLSAASVPSSPIPAFIEREFEFRFLAVLPETLDGEPFANPAVLCGRYSDEEFFQIRCKG
ncbi:hypothetical protein F3Y22_tig00111392pilonHSYRG00008 [Hibiscus syriacus]|uniref:Uncharacterized protein n=1 Tax=Hibiscus syriacus TaxID=106335 RepID=A0A6A2XW21_HIBSY|nr:hypothetical protein F3Y22_tig00111392pilonHSYRG00008 [Hibiscus syriacus]